MLATPGEVTADLTLLGQNDLMFGAAASLILSQVRGEPDPEAWEFGAMELVMRRRISVIATEGMAVVAVGGIRPDFQAESAEIVDVATHPFRLRQGLGSRIVERLEEEARGLGLHTIFLYAKDPSNHDFYTSLGYQLEESIDDPEVLTYTKLV